MLTPKRPDVYVQEESLLPPSAASVSTAIPAFIGHTQTGYNPDADGFPAAMRITSMLDYKTYFGHAQPLQVKVVSDASNAALDVIPEEAQTRYTLYHDVDMYFKNGGGPCYIISCGDYETAPSSAEFINGLTTLAKEDEPTLIVMPEASHLDINDYGSVIQQALLQCETLKDLSLIHI